MPNNWKTYKLGELGTIARGKSKHRPRDAAHLYGGNYPFIQTGDVKAANHRLNSHTQTYSKDGLAQSKLWPKNTMCITIAANIAETAIINYPACFPDSIIGFIANEALCDVDFVEYLMQHFKKQIQTHSIGSVQNNINLATFERVEFKVPPLPEQRTIASILTAIDDKIEHNLQMNKTLEEMAMTLYKHWFVDFGPFQDDEFVESELGMIPKGWEVKRLGEVLKIKHGYAFKGESFTTDENQNLLLTPGNFEMQGGIKFNWGKQKFYSGEYPSDYILKKGDLIIALTDLTQSCDILGAPALIPDEDYLYLHNQRLGLVEDLSPKLSKEIVYCLANTVAFRSHIKNGKTGSTVSHTSPSRIYDYQIALPTNGISAMLKEQLSELSELKFSNLSENKMLTQTRDTLLPKLISGEVRVKEAEQALADVL